VRPDAGRYAWLYAQMVRWGQTRFDPAIPRRLASLIRTDIYDAAMPGQLPPAEADPIGSILEPAFDPADLAGYLARFDARGLPKLRA
jgi:NitT/TauT family transport system ATP-binding protein